MESGSQNESLGTYWHIVEGKTWSQYALFVNGKQRSGFLSYKETHPETGETTLRASVVEAEVGKVVRLLIDRDLEFEEAVAAAEKYAGIWPESHSIPNPRTEN